MDVYPIGAIVKIGIDRKIEGIIQGIYIREDGVTYSIVWWDGNQRRNEWLYGNEIFENTAPVLNIGFMGS